MCKILLSWLGVILIFGLLATDAHAQRDRMQMGERLGGQVTRASTNTAPAPPAIDIVRGMAGAPEAALSGGMTATKLSPKIQAALGFLLRWGQGPSTAPPGTFNAETPLALPGQSATIPVKDARLLLPVRGLSGTPEGGVLVRQMAVSTKAGVATGQGKLEMDAQGRVTRVTLTK